MIALKRSVWLVLLLTVAACVTVNIYFPAAAAEKAADQIIEDIWQGNPSAMIVPPLYAPPAVSTAQTAARRALLGVLQLTSSQAVAQNIDFNASSPEISAIKSRMSARFAQIRPYYASGAIGFAADGFVVLRDASAVPMAERGKAQQLVNAENADRKALYAAIAQANNQPSWADQIRQVFAKRWIEQAESGWWVESGGWKQK